jgi:hypothetical protein
LVTFLDEVALFRLEEATKESDEAASAQRPLFTYHSIETARCPYCRLQRPKRRGRRRMVLLCWEQWHHLAQLDSSRTIPRWRPTTEDDQQELTTILTIDKHQNHQIGLSNHAQYASPSEDDDNYSEMILDRIRGRDFARNAIFVQSCEEAQQSVIDKQYGLIVRHHDGVASVTPASVIEVRPVSPTSPIEIQPVPSWSFDFEQYWHEWFEATRSPYGGACGTYAFVRVTIVDTKTKTVTGQSRYWQGFRRLIWASWMDSVILDVHLVDVVREMGCDDLDRVLNYDSHHRQMPSSSILKTLLDTLHVTIVVSGSLLVVTGGVDMGGTGFAFCRPNSCSGSRASPTMTAIPVRLSPDSFNHDVNIQVGMYPEDKRPHCKH